MTKRSRDVASSCYLSYFEWCDVIMYNDIISHQKTYNVLVASQKLRCPQYYQGMLYFIFVHHDWKYYHKRDYYLSKYTIEGEWKWSVCLPLHQSCDPCHCKKECFILDNESLATFEGSQMVVRNLDGVIREQVTLGFDACETQIVSKQDPFLVTRERTFQAAFLSFWNQSQKICKVQLTCEHSLIHSLFTRLPQNLASFSQDLTSTPFKKGSVLGQLSSKTCIVLMNDKIQLYPDFGLSWERPSWCSEGTSQRWYCQLNEGILSGFIWHEDTVIAMTDMQEVYRRHKLHFSSEQCFYDGQYFYVYDRHTHHILKFSGEEKHLKYPQLMCLPLPYELCDVVGNFGDDQDRDIWSAPGVFLATCPTLGSSSTLLNMDDHILVHNHYQ